uniref:Uncharacterized protein n=1 Tax=Microcebus murinus TaxID=30608 RepID=A0A8C5YI31_MICMU
MVLWSLALGALLLVTVLYLCLPGHLRQRGPQEPPLDKGTVPWLGHAMAFRKNTFGFLKRMWTKHGDVFTVQLAGHYFTFVMDPLSFGPILKETQKKLDFLKYAKELVQKTFGYYTKGENKQKMLLASNKYLRGHNLEDLNEGQGPSECLLPTAGDWELRRPLERALSGHPTEQGPVRSHQTTVGSLRLDYP